MVKPQWDQATCNRSANLSMERLPQVLATTNVVSLMWRWEHQRKRIPHLQAAFLATASGEHTPKSCWFASSENKLSAINFENKCLCHLSGFLCRLSVWLSLRSEVTPFDPFLRVLFCKQDAQLVCQPREYSPQLAPRLIPNIHLGVRQITDFLVEASLSCLYRNATGEHLGPKFSWLSLSSPSIAPLIGTWASQQSTVGKAPKSNSPSASISGLHKRCCFCRQLRFLSAATWNVANFRGKSQPEPADKRSEGWTACLLKSALTPVTLTVFQTVSAWHTHSNTQMIWSPGFFITFFKIFAC